MSFGIIHFSKVYSALKSATSQHWGEEAGSINVMGALVMVPLIGLIAYAVELGNLYAARGENQSISDLSAFSATVEFLQAQDENDARLVGESVALSANPNIESVTVSFVPSTNDPNRDAVQVEVSTKEQIFLGRLLGAPATTSVKTTSIVDFSSEGKGCILALNGSVTATNNSQLTSLDCGVFANGNIQVSNGATQINAPIIAATGNMTATNGAQLNGTRQTLSKPVVDPYIGFQPLDDAFNQVGGALPPVVPPIPGGASLSIPFGSAPFSFAGRTFQFDSRTREYVAPPGNYAISNLSVSANRGIRFPANSNVTVSGDIQVSSRGRLSLGGSVSARGALQVRSGGSLSIGDGDHAFGSIDLNTATGAIMIGDGNLNVSGEILVGDGVSLQIGQGEKRVGGGITLRNSTRLELGDGPLHVGGDVDIGNRAFMQFGQTAETFINGSIDTGNGSTTILSQSRYFVGGDLDVVNGSRFDGDGVNFVMGGAANIANGSITSLRAPIADGTLNIDNLLLATRTPGSIEFQNGSGFRTRGTIYAPNARISVRNAGNVSTAPDSCSILIGREIRFVNGSGLFTQCPQLSDDFSIGSGSIFLVQ